MTHCVTCGAPAAVRVFWPPVLCGDPYPVHCQACADIVIRELTDEGIHVAHEPVVQPQQPPCVVLTCTALALAGDRHDRCAIHRYWDWEAVYEHNLQLSRKLCIRRTRP